MGLGFLALVWIVFAHDMHFCQLLSAHCMSQNMEAIMGPQLAQLVGLTRKNHSGEGKNGIASENSEKFVNGWADTALAGTFCDLGANSLIRAGFSAISGHGLSHWPQFSAIFARVI